MPRQVGPCGIETPEAVYTARAPPSVSYAFIKYFLKKDSDSIHQPKATGIYVYESCVNFPNLGVAVLQYLRPILCNQLISMGETTLIPPADDVISILVYEKARGKQQYLAGYYISFYIDFL
jgi:hypothetical protein